MEKRMKKIQISVLSAILVVACGQMPVYAELIDFNRDISFERLDNGFILERNRDLQRTQTNEIIRGPDLYRKVKAFLQKTKDSVATFRIRRSNAIRGIELNQIANDNAKDLARRNKAALKEQRRLQRDKMMTARARNRDLKQRIRDLSRR
jgi:hypothetical protein